jgi:hypothetical protein
MCIHPENESPNVVQLFGRRTASPWIGQNSTSAVVISPEVAGWMDSTMPEQSQREAVLFNNADFYAEEDAENAKAPRECGYSLVWWLAMSALSVAALLVIAFADPVALSTTTTQGR